MFENFTIVSFVSALFWTYYLLIIARVLMSWFRLPSQGPLFSILKFIYDVTEPYLRLFRRIIPAVGPIDFSPFIAIIVLMIVQNIVVGLLSGL